VGEGAQVAAALHAYFADLTEIPGARSITARTSELAALVGSATGRAVFDALLRTTPSMAVIAGAEGKVLRATRFTADLIGWGVELEGLTIAELIAMTKHSDPQGRLFELEEHPLSRALKGEQVIGLEGVFSGRDGSQIPYVCNAAPLRTADGEVMGAMEVFTDLRPFKALERDLRAAVVEKEAAAAEKEMLYRELAHRVKNHLQIISGLVWLESRGAEPPVVEMAQRVAGHLTMLSGVYDRMTQAEVGGRIATRPFLEDVVTPYRTPSILVDVKAQENLTLPPDAAGPFGMLVNEAVCNSYKHAFPDHRPGHIEVTLHPSGPDRLELAITDDGAGWAGAADRPSHGLKLMRLLARQLGGEIEISDRGRGGCRVAVSLPISLAQTPQGGSPRPGDA
jgi:two-component sensor histidine kinase